uniref:RING-type E3 ubiquitin transferase n=1 Tax=Cyprinus carpio TaxID=7962 RepID=A0A8C1SL23_CYPCA
MLSSLVSRGSRCLFSHDLATSKPSTICKYYQRGVCAYGDRCRYDHVRPPGRGGPSAEQPNRSSSSSSAGASAPGPGPSSNTGKHAKKPLVLRDRALGSDGREGPEVRDCWDDKPHTYLDAIRSGLESSAGAGPYPDAGPQPQLCPYLAAGHCHYGDRCPYLHGDMCEICRLQVLHPHDSEQRAAHEKLTKRRASTMKSLQYSADFSCPDEPVLSALTGSLSTNNRPQNVTTDQSESSIPQSCVMMSFNGPDLIWTNNEHKKPCKYFDQGRGTCPFGGKCFYMHAYADGTRAEPDKPRKQLSAEGNVRFLNSVRLWDFIEEREHRGTAQDEDEVTELGELFMQLSGAGDQSGSAASH